MKKFLIGTLIFLAVLFGGGAVAYNVSPEFQDWTDKNVLKHEQVVNKDDKRITKNKR